MQQFNYPAITAQVNTGTVNSAAIPAKFITSFTAQGVFTDNAAAGTLKAQGSNDVSSPTHWSDIALATVAVTAGGTVCIPVTVSCYEWIRVTYTRSAGAGTFSVRVKALEEA